MILNAAVLEAAVLETVALEPMPLEVAPPLADRAPGGDTRSRGVTG